MHTLQKQTKQGFTLIELLVVIAIVGILATIGTATFQSQIQKANDAKRMVDMQNILDLIRRDSVVTRNGQEMYIYDSDGVEKVLDYANYIADVEGKTYCYFIGLAEGTDTGSGHDNEIVIASWGDASSTKDGNKPGVIALGTDQAVANLTNTPITPPPPVGGSYTANEIQNTLIREDFYCDLTVTMLKAQYAFECGQTTPCL